MENNNSHDPSVPPTTIPSTPAGPSSPQPAAPQQPLGTPNSNPGFVPSLIGLIFAFLPLQLIGLILSIIGRVKSRPKTSARTLSIVGIILNIIFGIIGAGIGVAIILAAYSGVQNVATADAFITAVQNKDIPKALSYTDDPNDAATRSFLEAASAKVGYSHSSVDTAYNDKRDKQGFVYSLEGGSSRYAKVTVSNTSGKTQVMEFYYSNNKLNATPGSESEFGNGSESASSSGISGESSSTTMTESQCLTSNDVASIPSLDKYIGSDSTLVFEHTVFFLPDSLDYPYAATSGELDQVASYIKSLGDKSFTVEIQGETATDRTTAASISFANQRAQKLNTELLSRGVSSSKIKVLSPNTINTSSNLSGDSISRAGSIFIRKNC